jgi:hypothetical protein
MPLVLTTPAEVTYTDNAARIEAFSVADVQSVAGPLVHVTYSVGFVDAESKYTARTTLTRQLDRTTIGTEMVKTATGTVYDAIKAALYAAMVADGVVGAGTVD